jgi:hypothetical protein
MADTFMAGGQRRKLSHWSGEYTTIVKQSLAVIAWQPGVGGISWDGTDVMSVDWFTSDDIIWWSGDMTYTVKSSTGNMTATWINMHSASCNDVDSMMTDTSWTKIVYFSGKVTTTVKQSQPLNTWGVTANGNCYNIAGHSFQLYPTLKNYLLSGHVTSTLLTSCAVAFGTSPNGVSFNGLHTMGCDETGRMLYTSSGQFTTVVIASQSTQAKEWNPRGIDTHNYDDRIMGSSLGDVAFDFPMLLVQSDFNPEVSIILPLFTANGEAFGGSGTADLMMPSMTALGYVAGQIRITLPILVLVVTRPDLASTLVMNTKTGAMSEYAGYEFNSYCQFNDSVLLAGSEGIYEANNTDHDGYQGFTILSRIRTGEVDTHVDGKANKMRNAFICYESDGGVRLSTTGDGSVSRSYPVLTENVDGVIERRVKFERGIRNRIFDIKIENISGAKLQLEKVVITLEPIQSRRG